DKKKSHEKLQALIDQYSLNQYIKLGQSVYSEQKEKVLLDSDFFILTSRTEGHPVALIEALSYGLPCLVTPGTNMAKEIMEYDAGWVADKAGIAQTLKELLDNRAQLKSKGYNASTLSTKYEWSRIAIETINRYKEL
ncbi:MAG: glycosyltransferase, partial [Actinobacteria bacterium]|nr:glycosyltransferase [Actinomycetota bacterium]